MFNLEQDADLELIRDADPVEAVEAAKRIIQYQFPPDQTLLDALREIAVNKNQKDLARVMAVYTLGFVDHARCSASQIRQLLKDTTESDSLRDHAAEALGNMYDPNALSVLIKLANTDESPEVRESCLYAIGQLCPEQPAQGAVEDAGQGSETSAPQDHHAQHDDDEKQADA